MQSPPPDKRRRREVKDEDADADRIGALPEDILHRLLSLLPAHERCGRACWARGGATCGGPPRRPRHRRRGVGQRRQVQQVPGRPAPPPPPQRHARLESCVFDLDEIDFGFLAYLPASEQRHLSDLARRAPQGPGARFRLCSFEQRLRQPDLPLVSQHLTTLELARVRVNDRVLDLSACPLLVDLIMNCCYIGAVQMSSPSLRRLIITDCAFFHNARTRMSLPGLLALKMTLQSGRAPLIESMPLLETAIVSLLTTL
ncbi:hypothetical protein E2562_001948 [Oryza meyeriana var. granulata]|uniref:F-box domain-containing protein n=1 Tax=Oryza meyeriana var. granulata TaxID=110450 RepID=A0A6G1C1X6_9ORYZ|nr:hypothetical protein E2562_001948 [Oryza meyeriana var. granulata]